jgi:parallel beta-helix repeat protein
MPSGIDVKYSGAQDIRVFNNTVYGNKNNGIYVQNAPNTKLVNNIIYSNGHPIVLYGSNPGLVQSSNFFFRSIVRECWRA